MARTNKKMQSVALWQIYLIVSISFIVPSAFAQAAPGVGVTLDVPSATNRNSIPINGMTASGAQVYVKVGGTPSATSFDASTIANTDGRFLVSSVTISNGANAISVLAVDTQGNSGYGNAVVVMDQRPPQVHLDNVPAMLNTTSITIGG